MLTTTCLVRVRACGDNACLLVSLRCCTFQNAKPLDGVLHVSLDVWKGVVENAHRADLRIAQHESLMDRFPDQFNIILHTLKMIFDCYIIISTTTYIIFQLIGTVLYRKL